MEFFAFRRSTLADIIQRECSLVITPFDGHFMPTTIAELATDGNYLSATSQVIPQSQRSFDQLDLEEVIRASVVCIQQQSIRLIGFELKLQRSVQRYVPFSKLSVRRRSTFQQKAQRLANQKRTYQKKANHGSGVIRTCALSWWPFSSRESPKIYAFTLIEFYVHTQHFKPPRFAEFVRR